MNLCAAVSVAAFIVGLAVSALAFGIASAPRFARYRALGAVALVAAIFCLGELTQSIASTADVIMPVAGVQSVFAVLFALCWNIYSDQHLQRTPTRVDTIARVALLGVGILWVVPGFGYREPLMHVAFPRLGCVITFPQTTTFGTISYVFELLMVGVVVVRYVQAWRRGVYGAIGHIVAISTMLLAALHDSIVTIGLSSDPFVLSTGFLFSLVSLGVLLAQDFMREAEELNSLKQQLEQRVEERTAELVTAESALMRSEKLAAIGQLSAGVAHEINNPAAVVRANLEWLRDELQTAPIPKETLDSLDDSLEAIDRVAKIVRQLLDLGRAASNGTGSTMLAKTVDRAVAAARASIRDNIVISVDVPDALWVRADEASVVQILVNLIVNGAQAIPEDRDAKLEITGSEKNGKTSLKVIDNGSGMTEETRKRAFEPFFTTKPFGQGTGLGLSLSLGIARSLGGSLDCDTRPGKTTMTLVLPNGEPTEVISERRIAAAKRRSLLLVEDDDRVRRALTRMLSTPFSLEVASGVDDAMARLAKSKFDIVLSDWRMPAGGGRRLYKEATERWPSLASVFMFVTGGGLSSDDQEFLEPHKVLEKPLSLEKLLEAVEERTRSSAISPPPR